MPPFQSRSTGARSSSWIRSFGDSSSASIESASFAWLEIGAMVGQPLDPANKTLTAWQARVAARPSIAAAT